MGKLIYTSMVSLDGFISGVDQSLDWVLIDEELHTFVNNLTRKVDTFLYGRWMYEMMAAFWPTADADPANPDFIADFSRIWKGKPKIVVSSTLKQVEWNSILVKDLSAPEIAQIKAQPGRDIGLGGAGVAGTLLRQGLIDEYQLYLHPVVLGEGTRMFPDIIKRASLTLLETKTFGSGVVYLRYQANHAENS